MRDILLRSILRKKPILWWKNGENPWSPGDSFSLDIKAYRQHKMVEEPYTNQTKQKNF